MGMTTHEFDNITVCEFISKQKGFFELERQRERSQWNRTIALINIQLPRGKKIDPNSLFRERKPVKVQTREEFENVVKQWENYHVTRQLKLPVPG